MSQELLPLVEECVRTIGRDRQIDVPENMSPDTALFGKEGLLDSIGLVSLVLAVEEAIEDQFGVSISLADQRAMSQKHSPFRSIGALAEYAGRLLEETGDHHG